MKRLLSIITIMGLIIQVYAAPFDSDTLKTSAGPVVMTFIGHGTLVFTFNNQVIHVDPVSRYADYTSLPDADLILITHQHGDHLDKKAVDAIIKEGTVTFLTESCLSQLPGTVLKNGDEKTIGNIKIEAVPAYNLEHKRDNGQPFHPKGIGNGYVLTFGDKRIYVAGDTEDIPEMADLKNIDVAFLPMNLPYTMNPEMVAHSVSLFHPKILYPYHYGSTDVNKLISLMGDSSCEVRVRNLQ